VNYGPITHFSTSHAFSLLGSLVINKEQQYEQDYDEHCLDNER